jgi:hypothetical protein
MPPGNTSRRDKGPSRAGECPSDDLGGTDWLGDEGSREPSIFSTIDIRWAMNFRACGEMALSCSASWYHDGMDLHPAALAFSVRAATGSGRCVA